MRETDRVRKGDWRRRGVWSGRGKDVDGARHEDNDGWEIVRGRRHGGEGRRYGKSNMQIASSGSARAMAGRRGYTSFFFTNFLKKCWARDMYEVFSRHGKVHEVVIPGRINAFGRRFGFVRFFDVNDPRRMATKMDNIFVENEKLYVNLPRFQKEHPNIQRFTDLPEKRAQSSQRVWQQKKTTSHVLPGQSFKDAVIGGHEVRSDSVIKCDWSYDSSNEDFQKLSLAMGGEVIHPGKSYSIPDEFLRQGFFQSRRLQ